MTYRESQEWQELSYGQYKSPRALLHQLGHYILEHLDLARERRLVAAPRIRKIEHALTGQSTGIHAPAIHYRLTQRLQTAPDVRMIGLGPIRQMKDFMLIVRQARVNRVPLDPRLEAIGIEYVGNCGEYLRRIIELGEIGELAFAHPFIEEWRANFVKFQEEYLAHRTDPALVVNSNVCCEFA